MGKTQRKIPKSIAAEINPLVSPIQALQSLIEKFEGRGVIIGAVAASLLGTPRFTSDLDATILIGLDDLPTLLSEALKLGIEPRIEDTVSFARRNRVLLLRHSASKIDIDLSLGILPFEVEMIERSQLLGIGGMKIRLPTPEDLVIMKAVAGRPKDLEDIRAIAAAHPELDRERIHLWLDQFAEALEEPVLWSEIEKLL